MTRPQLPPSLQAELGALKRRVDSLERRLGVLDSKYRPEVEFSYSGPLTEAASDRAPRRVAGRLEDVIAELSVAGSTDTVVDVLQNDVAVAAVTVPAGQQTVKQMVTGVVFSPDVDKLRVEITTAGSGAEGLVVVCRFNR